MPKPEQKKENLSLRVDLDYSGDLVRGAVRFGRAVEQMTDDAPQHDTATMLPHIDSKRRKKLRQKENRPRPCRGRPRRLGYETGTMKGTPMARKRKENISEVMFSYVGTDAQFDEFLKMLFIRKHKWAVKH